jgi:hypothetical protein
VLEALAACPWLCLRRQRTILRGGSAAGKYNLRRHDTRLDHRRRERGGAVRTIRVDGYLFAWKKLREKGLSEAERQAYQSQLDAIWRGLTQEERTFLAQELEALGGAAPPAGA